MYAPFPSNGVSVGEGGAPGQELELAGSLRPEVEFAGTLRPELDIAKEQGHAS